MFSQEWKISRIRQASLRLLLVGILVVLGPAIAAAQTFDDELADLRAELADSFEILPLSDGWLLQPICQFRSHAKMMS